MRRHDPMRGAAICALAGVLALAGCELILVDKSVKDFTVDGGGSCASRCDDRCVDLRSDPEHCGDCDTACGADERCVDSECIGDVVMCPPELDACGGECVDISSSWAHCGECFRPCDGDCVDGMCDGDWCGSGDLVCPGVGCVSPRSRLHCGGCGNACEAGDLCVGERCQPDPCGGTGEVECDGTCVDLRTSNAHCGSCGSPCAGTCVDGECGASCDPGLSDCAALGCLDLGSDRTSCGGCRRACGPGEACSGGICGCAFSEACGVCASPYSYPHCGGVCEVHCSPDRGQMCDASGCRPAARPYAIYPDPLVGGTIFPRAGVYVCPDFLTDDVARVACRDGGFVGGRIVVGDLTGLARIPGLQSVTCAGTEATLDDCVFATAPGCAFDRLLIACDEGP